MDLNSLPENSFEVPDLHYENSYHYRYTYEPVNRVNSQIDETPLENRWLQKSVIFHTF